MMRRRRPLSIRTQLTLWNAGGLGIALLVLGVAIRFSISAYLLLAVDNELTSRAVYMRHLRFPSDRNESRQAPTEDRRQDYQERHSGEQSTAPPMPRPLQNDPYAPRLFDKWGHGRAPFTHTTPFDKEAMTAATTGEIVFSTVVEDGEHLRVCTMPILERDGAIGGVLQVPSRLTAMERGLMAVDQTMLTVLPLALAITVTGSVLLTSRAIRPIEDALEQEKRFVADASHELRTPVAIIRAAVDIGLEAAEIDNDPTALRRALERIDIASNRTRRIVDDLLLLARVDGNAKRQTKRDGSHFDLLPEPVPAKELLDETALLFDTVRGARRIIVNASPSDLYLILDRHHFGRVLSNLVDNAVRHTPPDTGTVTLTATRTAQDMATITVMDNGTGIAEADLPHVFRRFYRADTARTRGAGGTGLGLAIARAIVEAHGGTITLQSTLNVGTTVTLTVPCG